MSSLNPNNNLTLRDIRKWISTIPGFSNETLIDTTTPNSVPLIQNTISEFPTEFSFSPPEPEFIIPDAPNEPINIFGPVNVMENKKDSEKLELIDLESWEQQFLDDNL